jgi:serine/threonine-protein phosphatase 2B catalytic subunit
VDNTTGLQSNVWTFNESRGCSYYFGYHAISEFLRRNELVTLIRAHEAQFDGFKAYVWQNWQFPQVITIFSAPNYCGTYANKGALIKLSGNEMKIHQYNSTQKPDLVAHLGDAFYWSVPILSKALMDMLVGFI